MEYRNYNKEPLEFIKQCNHIARSLKSYNCPILEVLISSYDIMKFLDQKDVIKFLFISKTTYVCLGVYQISFKNFDTITLTLKNGNAQPPFKDYVWDAEQNSFNYSNSNGNQQIEFRNNIDNEYIVDKTDNIHFAGDINSADDF
jgi:hypothetical protein